MKLIVANWKMYLEVGEATRFAEQIVRAVPHPKARVVICPSACALMSVGAVVRRGSYVLGAQDVGIAKEGAFTGQISPKDLHVFECAYVIVGHSERRQLLGETDKMVRQKLETALASGLQPILCVGETKAERRKGKANVVVRRQLTSALKNLQPILRQAQDPEPSRGTTYPSTSSGSRAKSRDNLQTVIIAYEPIWAIGTGKPATTEQVVQMHAWVRSFAKKTLPSNTKIQILYGGSVSAKTITSLLSYKEVDGVLIGGASTQRSFIDILQKIR